MEQVAFIGDFQVYKLTKDFAQQHIAELVTLCNQIPQVKYTEEEVLAESKGNRILWKKWEHSLVLLDREKVIGVITGYERESENNQQYPQNTLYINELSIAKKYQGKGLGKNLLEVFLTYNKRLGFLYLSGIFNFSVQTNGAKWNNPVVSLYKKFEFSQRSTKTYDNRTDVVLGVTSI